ncbi:MAG: hypothetical protein ABDH32_02455 [Candidatus Caldarchaeales archaeon]
MEIPFTSYSSPSRVIIIEANQELEKVRVLDNSSNILCLFDKIPRNSEEICNVKEYEVYLVQYNGLKDAVECMKPEIIEPRPID